MAVMTILSDAAAAAGMVMQRRFGSACAEAFWRSAGGGAGRHGSSSSFYLAQLHGFGGGMAALFRRLCHLAAPRLRLPWRQIHRAAPAGGMISPPA